jgi:HK97 gp10 family phage protein
VNNAVKITGINQLRRTIDRLPAKLKKRAEVPVLRAGAKPIHTAAKRKVPTGTGESPGLLKRALGITVKKVKGIYSARIGARTGYSVKIKSGKKKDPSKYIHLVELGTRHSAPRPFIRPAIDSSKGEVLGAMSKGLETHLHRTAKRLAKKASA